MLTGGEVTDESDGAAPRSPGARRRRRILVIDDDRNVGDGLQLALEVDGHEVCVALDGEQGLALAERFAPDVVLCDISMPSMDGYEVARAFRAHPPLSGVFLVALTGYAQAVDRERARRAGFDEHLAKPVDMENLQALLARR